MKTELDNKVKTLSDVDPTTAFLLLKKYLIEDDLYSRKQEIELDRKDKQLEYLDLFYILILVDEKMYHALSTEDKKNAIYSFIDDKGKYICVSKNVRSYEMNDKFIEQLDKDSAKEIFVGRDLIELGFKKILPYHHAVLKYHIFLNLTFEKGLSKYEPEIKKLAYMTKRNRLNKAIEALVTAIQRIEYNIWQKSLTK